jgi:hypothetical protein
VAESNRSVARRLALERIGVEHSSSIIHKPRQRLQIAQRSQTTSTMQCAPGVAHSVKLFFEEEHMPLRSIIAPQYLPTDAQNGTGGESGSRPLEKFRETLRLIRHRGAHFGSP